MGLLSVLPQMMPVAIDDNAVASNAILATVSNAVNGNASATVAVVTAAFVAANVQWYC